MRKMPPLISEDGTITIHGQEGAEIFITLADDAGQPRDVSGVSVDFKIPGFTKSLTATGAPGELRLLLTQTDLPNLIGKVVDYAIIESTGIVPTVHYYGKLVMLGWR